MINIIDLRENKENDLYNKLLSRSHMETDGVLNIVEDILKRVKAEGDNAILDFTQRFDGVKLSPDQMIVSDEEIEQAFQMVDKELIDVIKKAYKSIKNFHEKQKDKSWFSNEDDGVILGQMVTPIECTGVYVPGGTASYPSSVLMNVIPAKVAGVSKVIMVTPPRKDGSVNPAILVAARIAGVDKILKIGGAQAIAALAFGTKIVPKVDKIVGPGNIYVAMAKKLVFGFCNIDMIAGPSEIMIVADNSAKARYVAADLLSQAEHDALASSIMVTTSEKFADSVREEVNKQIATLQRKDIIIKSITDFGAIIIVKGMEDAVELVNKLAPEHLELCVDEPFNLLGSIKNAGAIFLGNYSSEPLGDYIAGPNHVLPTSGTARFFSPLNVGDFVKRSSIISYTRNALTKVGRDVMLFAEAEELSAHANAIRVRLEDK